LAHLGKNLRSSSLVLAGLLVGSVANMVGHQNRETSIMWTLFAQQTTRRRIRAGGWLFLLTVVSLAPGAASPVAAPTLVYVSNSSDPGAISVICASDNRIIDTIGFDTWAFGLAVSPEGDRLYVGNGLSDRISVVEPITGTVLATIATADTPVSIVVSPDGDRVYAAVRDHPVMVIDAESLAVLATVPVGQAPEYVAISSDGSLLVAANFRSHDVSVIDTATNAVVATVPVGLYPAALAFAPGGPIAWVTAGGSLLISIIDVAQGQLLRTIPTPGPWPAGVVFLPDGSRAYVAILAANQVSVFDVPGEVLLTTIPVGQYPTFPAVSPDGTRVFVPNRGSDSVSVIDTAMNTVVSTIAVSDGPLEAVTAPAPPPQGGIAILIDRIGDLMDGGDLSSGLANSLVVKLQNATKLLTDSIERNDVAAMNAILAFINEVQGLVNGGWLTQAQGRPLIDAAGAIADRILAIC